METGRVRWVAWVLALGGLVTGCGATGSGDVAVDRPPVTATSTTITADAAGDCEMAQRTIETAAAAYLAVNAEHPNSIDDLVGEYLKPDDFAYDLRVEGSGEEAEVVLVLSDHGREVGCPEPTSEAADRQAADPAREVAERLLVDQACRDLVAEGEAVAAGPLQACLDGTFHLPFDCPDGSAAAIVGPVEDQTWVLVEGEVPAPLPDDLTEEAYLASCPD